MYGIPDSKFALRYPKAQVQVADVAKVMKLANDLAPNTLELSTAASHMHRCLAGFGGRNTFPSLAMVNDRNTIDIEQ